MFYVKSISYKYFRQSFYQFGTALTLNTTVPKNLSGCWYTNQNCSKFQTYKNTT